VDNADWGGVSIPVLVVAIEQLKAEDKLPLAVVHSHNMRGFTEINGVAQEKQTELKLSGKDRDFSTRTGVVVCAVTEDRWICTGGATMRFMLATAALICLSVGANCESQPAIPLDRQSVILGEITRLQDISEGHWNHSMDLKDLDPKSFGVKRMSEGEVAFLLDRADLYLERRNGLSLFLRLYKYSDVKPLWQRLRLASERAGTFNTPFKMIVSNPLDGNPKFEIRTISGILKCSASN
jgi:hypothetical protein